MAPAIPARIQALDLPPFDPLSRRAAELRAAGHPVISLGQAVPAFPPPSAALEAARAALGRPETHRYVTDPGLPSLRRLLAQRLGETLGNTFSLDDLVITAGGNHVFALATTTLLEPGDEVILPAPYFTNHHMMLWALGMTPIEAPVADGTTFRVTWADIEPHLTARTKAIVLCTPSNPSGAVIDAVEGRRIVEKARTTGLLVISDETYMRFVFEGAHWSAASLPDWRSNVIVIGTFSKSFGMMGWRLGFVLADAAVCTQAVKVQDAQIICAPVIAQVAGEAAVRDAWDYPLQFHPDFQQKRALLAAGLEGVPRLSWTPTAGGFFAFVRVDGCRGSATLSARLLEEAHVVTIPGAAFGASGEGHLRLSFGFASSDELAEAIERLRLFFAAAD